MIASTKSSELLVPPAHAKQFKTDSGAVYYWELASNVQASRIEGFFSLAMAKFLMDQSKPMFSRPEKAYSFYDWTSMANYESACRVVLTKWGFTHRNATEFHVAFSSRLVGMGVSVANLALGGIIKEYRDAASIEQAAKQIVESLAPRRS